VDKPEYSRQAHHDPAELAAHSHASGQIGLHDEESHCSPENYFERIQDPVRFVALPAAKSLDMLGGDLVGDEHEGFGVLCLCQLMGFRGEECLGKGSPCLRRSCLLEFAAGLS
jgi:hypothetical protein